jgi:hypothetical protein
MRASRSARDTGLRILEKSGVKLSKFVVYPLKHFSGLFRLLKFKIFGLQGPLERRNSDYCYSHVEAAIKRRDEAYGGCYAAIQFLGGAV